MMYWVRCSWWQRLLLALALLGNAPTAPAQDAAAAIREITVGFQGFYKVGYWTPVWITISANEPFEGKLSLSTGDGDGVSVLYEAGRQDSIRLAAGDSRTVLRFVKFGRVSTEDLTAQLTTKSGQTFRRVLQPGEFPKPQPTDQTLIVTLGDRIGELEAVGRRNRTGASVLLAQVEQADLLPDHWLGYEGVDTVIVATHQNAVLSELTDEQFAALEQWVQMGGRLLLTVGARGEDMLDESAPVELRRWIGLIPGDIVTVSSRPSLAALESYAGSPHPLEGSAGEHAALRTPVLENVRGTTELSGSGTRLAQPIVVRAPHGFGQVVFVALDLEQPPFADWQGRSRLVARLLRNRSQNGAQIGPSLQGGKVAHVGFTDLSGQLRSALDQFTGISLVPFYWVAGLVFLYALFIGPGDYLFLQRVVQRMQVTWLTFPLIVLAFAATAMYLYGAMKESDVLRINQVDLVDVDVSEGVVRGSTWADIYSPDTEIYDLSWQTTAVGEPIVPAGSPTIGSWLGLPGTGLGGLNTTASSSSFTEPYRIVFEGPSARLLATPIQTSSTKAFQARWWHEFSLGLEVDLAVDDGLLRGIIQNPLPVELTDCRVLFGSWLYRLESRFGKLAPRDTVRIETEQPLDLEWHLTQRRLAGSRNISTPWSSYTLDVPRILEMMMFHGSAGGDRYTQLKHRYQSFVDLSQQLDHGRAILLGRSAERATSVRVDGQDAADRYDQAWTFYRVVFPVRAWQADPRS